MAGNSPGGMFRSMLTHQNQTLKIFSIFTPLPYPECAPLGWNLESVEANSVN